MVTEGDLFEQVIVTGEDRVVPRGVAGVLMDIGLDYAIIESAPSAPGAEPRLWVVARDAVSPAQGTAAA